MDLTDIEYALTENNLHIADSYKVRKKQMKLILKEIYHDYMEYYYSEIEPTSKVWRRSYSSLYWEWLVHNFLYSIRYKRERTKDVDLNYPCDHKEWVYKVIGMLVWVFVK